MYPEEYQEFSRLIKEYVVLHIILKVLEYDRKAIRQSTCKFSNLYDQLLTNIQWKIEYDLRRIKKNIKKLGGTIISQEQQSAVRVVKTKFKGFVYTHRYLNYVLQAESEELLKTYINSI
ncbi:hypothetical protein BHF71_02945 [Vulcanibacillus modesticaldus]|uniref:Uncharacterized protein n=2 Tax=Vulcanibacillus modesticaldus TaxID=337097 RepID=A0A1D2YT82_9BACI|nr:hypothetical protein BHF71_02945 [Vulcanibacillus modesticaldus]